MPEPAPVLGAPHDMPDHPPGRPWTKKEIDGEYRERRKGAAAHMDLNEEIDKLFKTLDRDGQGSLCHAEMHDFFMGADRFRNGTDV